MFYWTVYDNAMYLPALEMSCRQVKYLPELFYLYNYNTGQTDDAYGQSHRQAYDHILRHINDQKPYRCLAMEFLEIANAPEP